MKNTWNHHNLKYRLAAGICCAAISLGSSAPITFAEELPEETWELLLDEEMPDIGSEKVQTDVQIPVYEVLPEEAEKAEVEPQEPSESSEEASSEDTLSDDLWDGLIEELEVSEEEESTELNQNMLLAAYDTNGITPINCTHAYKETALEDYGFCDAEKSAMRRYIGNYVPSSLSTMEQVKRILHYVSAYNDQYKKHTENPMIAGSAVTPSIICAACGASARKAEARPMTQALWGMPTRIIRF